ncbi:hypothetical protein CYMTET_32039 [Cymbomonas tetramitiformis]|uniref:Uncharacterized protein n=1 Tax=Cymbomonas tetramitiformis TaxID=36881 RepID=A0AAE0FFT9_9CHLO|nr:hypothetical protein CYMTET_32039 [Cymbomonas tetramitiformis]
MVSFIAATLLRVVPQQADMRLLASPSWVPRGSSRYDYIARYDTVRNATNHSHSLLIEKPFEAREEDIPVHTTTEFERFATEVRGRNKKEGGDSSRPEKYNTKGKDFDVVWRNGKLLMVNTTDSSEVARKIYTDYRAKRPQVFDPLTEEPRL